MAGLIEDNAIIGNCETDALVGRDGSIDWLSLPRFDAAACFAALLGGPAYLLPGSAIEPAVEVGSPMQCERAGTGRAARK